MNDRLELFSEPIIRALRREFEKPLISSSLTRKVKRGARHRRDGSGGRNGQLGEGVSQRPINELESRLRYSAAAREKLAIARAGSPKAPEKHADPLANVSCVHSQTS